MATSKTKIDGSRFKIDRIRDSGVIELFLFGAKDLPEGFRDRLAVQTACKPG